ncbi:MAG TPA: acetyl-coenzyme A synthetase [Gemmatimonas aurantiaca]|uniref:Acetyl-coenzyme A synthetase n=2 Tax=Gemmatimonas aurantiaca TaxID=173480 RepID=ACSA_GEMAT|nr:acetate--CoA ligase [Gemmatimonas aurantiaca]C1AA44.1 RecName: Full=Acetyl-coenzyme A synthetase; Short=AcCoA synthetase; Short=Acs; AltName: Full=Acetate--CoA ligase; AltName: Full=Acyl-activating enzyme [Gemmatimonas aurantiaca T-27]BAH39642.1 acetyl-coenzyme A synthetase [Gemmatimonas aurantiaca T-27]HCT58349.1 acetyl-coenzyme A synthetase [Gemmatimonas aurantiaca]
MSDIDVLLQETRTFPPSEEFRAGAWVRDNALREAAAADPVGFWAKESEALDWMTPWSTALEWEPPRAKWFQGGTLNASVNCIDRHVHGPRRNKAALIWEGEPGDRRTFTYWDLYREVNLAANMLKKLGVGRGDRVAIYLPMIPEAVIAMLACARIGAIHTVVFGGFAPESLRDRINDCGCKLLITADGGSRRGQMVPLKRNADVALKECPSIENVLVVMRRRSGVGDETFAEMQEGRDHWWHRLKRQVPRYCEPEAMDAEDVLFVLYTSGTTGKPKGIVHTTGGFLTGVATTTKYTFDLKEEDVYWCTADIGWITGHSYLVYGPLANGATCVMYEGAPDWPDKDRFWQICERYGVTILYTAPTAIRAFMKWGTEYVKKHDLSQLRVLGSVGEPINPEAWMWYHEHIGDFQCPIVDTWWQTETGAIMITPLPGVTTTKPGSATVPFPGIRTALLDANANELTVGGGLLAITHPWPSMLRTIWGDDQRYVDTYFSKWPGRPDLYFPGDGAKLDEDGYLWILGRVDDVLNVSGHRIGTMEVESALVDHPSVAEAAVVGKHHDLKGQAIAAFVTLRAGFTASGSLRDELRDHVAQKIGALARPDDILFSADLPKTRSGKIMRRLLRDIAEGRALGDTTTLADPSVVASLKDQYEAQES